MIIVKVAGFSEGGTDCNRVKARIANPRQRLEDEARITDRASERQPNGFYLN
jgi:hypothetical protein